MVICGSCGVDVGDGGVGGCVVAGIGFLIQRREGGAAASLYVAWVRCSFKHESETWICGKGRKL